MADSRAGAGKMQGKPGSSYKCKRVRRCSIKRRKEHRNQPEGAPMAKTGIIRVEKLITVVLDYIQRIK